MPTSGDLKLEDCLFFTTAQNLNDPPPQIKLTQPNGNALGHYMMSYMMYTLSNIQVIYDLSCPISRSVPLKSWFLSSNQCNCNSAIFSSQVCYLQCHVMIQNLNFWSLPGCCCSSFSKYSNSFPFIKPIFIQAVELIILRKLTQ